MPSSERKLSMSNDGFKLKSSFTVFGHRGAAGLAPENTLPSFERALSLGCAGIEFDVHRIWDKNRQPRLCVIHDDRVDRTTNGRGLVSSFSAETMSKLDAGSGAGVPMLEAVAALAENRDDILLNIELKGKDTAVGVAEFLSSHQEISALVSSFDHRELTKFRSLDAKTRVAPLFAKQNRNMLQIAANLNASCINVEQTMVTDTLITQCSEHGYPVLAYTVNQFDRAKWLKSLGVAGVFTDRPDLIVALQETN